MSRLKLAVALPTPHTSTDPEKATLFTWKGLSAMDESRDRGPIVRQGRSPIWIEELVFPLRRSVPECGPVLATLAETAMPTGGAEFPRSRVARKEPWSW